jgi:hypothetical protein
VDPPEFLIADPDLEQLEKLFLLPDPRSESEGEEEEEI